MATRSSEELKKDLEELIAKLLVLTVDTYENFFNIIVEFLRKVSPIPLVIPQIVLPEDLKRKKAEDLARILASLIVAPLNPQQVLKIVEEVSRKVEELKKKYLETGTR
ncbi:MAG: hypothetical protein GXO23_05165 [Crenarchaeota archaeon]|nr:hypothetical protein [Thermoproteota archaeon]